MTRSERLLAIIQALRGRRRPLAAGALAERFAVSARTIYRDVAMLNGQGAVIEGSAGLGYLLRDDVFVPPLAFNREEAAALLLGLRFVQRRGDAGLVEAASSAHDKLAAVLPARFDDGAALGVPLVVAPPAERHADTLAIVREALTRERKLRITYIDLAGLRTKRVVWPILLGWFDELEMLGAWCELRQAFRSFASTGSDRRTSSTSGRRDRAAGSSPNSGHWSPRSRCDTLLTETVRASRYWRADRIGEPTCT